MIGCHVKFDTDNNLDGNGPIPTYLQHFLNYQSEAKTNLAHVILAVINVNRAVVTGKAGDAVAGVVSDVIAACSAIATRVEFLRTERDRFLAEFSHKASSTRTCVRQDSVDAGRVIRTAVIETIVDVGLTP